MLQHCGLRRTQKQGSIILCHDIGAIGYLSDRDIIDIAGLATPELIPYIHKHEDLWKRTGEESIESKELFKRYFPDRTRARSDYFVLYPSWYADLIYTKKLKWLKNARDMRIFKIE